MIKMEKHDGFFQNLCERLTLVDLLLSIDKFLVLIFLSISDLREERLSPDSDGREKNLS